MTHDELLTKIEEIHKSCSAGGSDKDVPKSYNWPCYNLHSMAKSLRAVVELHSPFDGYCQRCTVNNWGELRQEYPCDEIQAIEKELSQ